MDFVIRFLFCFFLDRGVNTEQETKIREKTDPRITNKLPGDHIYQPLRSGRIWHKINF